YKSDYHASMGVGRAIFMEPHFDLSFINKTYAGEEGGMQILFGLELGEALILYEGFLDEALVNDDILKERIETFLKSSQLYENAINILLEGGGISDLEELNIPNIKFIKQSYVVKKLISPYVFSINMPVKLDSKYPKNFSVSETGNIMTQDLLKKGDEYDIISIVSPGGVGVIGYEALASDFISPIGDDFFSLREYISGDDLRKIHWKSTAKTSTLMIRKVDDATISRVAVIVDGFRGSHLGSGKESTFEYLISAAATIVNYFAKNNYRVRIVVSGDRLYVIPFDDASRNYHRIMEVFAKCEPIGNISPDIIFSKELDTLPTGSNIVFLTTSFNTDWLDKLKRIKRRGQMRIALVLVEGETFLPMSEVLYKQKMTMLSGFLAKIYGSGISVCLLRKGCDIKSSLEGIKSDK
ncbi:unnamed protein product, partial [marine sediment metagenome]